MTTAVFKRLGPYDIERQIGRGGMADVYLATDARSGRPVALKVVSRALDPEQQDIVRAERQGAELQRCFSEHSAFVPAVYEHGIEGDFFYVAMEYFDGENLSAVIAAGMPVERAVSIARELCRFIEDAERFETTTADGRHVHSLIHGDLTPKNIRITSSGHIRILDFGIAKALSLSRRVTRNDFGNLAYLSPERLETGDVDRHADFWALGVLLYEMVRGQRPFAEPDTRQLEKRILARRPPPSLAGACPVGVQAIVAKLLAPSVADRYDTARAIGDDLARAAAGTRTVAEDHGWPGGDGLDQATRRTAAGLEPEATRRTVPSASVPDVAPPVLVPAPVPAAPARSRPSRRVRWGAVAAVLIAVLSMNEMWLRAQARRVAVQLPTRELDGLPDAWQQYEVLARRSYLGLGTLPLRRSLIDRTSRLAERVIADYRSSQPSVREAQWKKTREALSRALAVSSDKSLRAAARLCDGHLYRINGEADLSRHQLTEARRDFTDAVAAFRDAAELRPGWPDPFLGLARTFVYGLQDVERGADALKQAEKYGYLIGDRETAQLADGYRARGDALSRSARPLNGLPQQHELLTRAAEAYRQAVDLYLKAIAYGDSARNLRGAQRELERVENLLAPEPPPLDVLPPDPPVPPGLSLLAPAADSAQWG